MKVDGSDATRELKARTPDHADRGSMRATLLAYLAQRFDVTKIGSMATNRASFSCLMSAANYVLQYSMLSL
jgi:hypothetical protein